LSLAPPSDAIFLHRNGQNYGPYSIDQLNSWIADGTIHPSDMAWHEGLPGWLPLTCLPGIHAPSTTTRQPPSAKVANRETEVKILDQTLHALCGLVDDLAQASADDSKEIQQHFQRRLDVYWNQIKSFNAQFPEDVQGKRFESGFYFCYAALKYFSSGFWRGFSEDSQGLVGQLLGGAIAHQQEKRAAR
jgi:hypothetical protein